MAASGKRRLGRGLDGLLPEGPSSTSSEVPGVSQVPVEELRPNREQPRRQIDEAALEELAQSIREHGILEPVLARRRREGGYVIVAGERRWRAAQKAGLKEIPVFVRELSEEAAFEAALVENLQREDLSPIETARAFQRLVEEHGHSQESVAARVGKDRSTVANMLRLLKLPEDVLEMIEDGELSEGHGRALLGAADADAMRTLARAVRDKRLSVRETERRIRQSTRGDGSGAKGSKGRGSDEKSANVRDLERRLSHTLGSTVAVEGDAERGRLIINYGSAAELDSLLRKLLKQ